MTTRVTTSQAYRHGLAEEMRTDPRILVYGTDLFERGGHWGQVRGLGEEFGRDRVRNTPISEAAMIASGVGAAMNGLRPVVDLNFMDFAFGAIDEIVNQAAKIRYMWGSAMPLVIRGTNGVAAGGAQHNNSFESWFAHTPGLLVAMPSTPADTKGLIKSALRGEDPVIFMMHKLLAAKRGEIGGPDDVVPFGQATIRRPGSSVTIVSYGVTVDVSLQASENLAEQGLDAEVIDLRTVAPLDLETVEASVRKTRHLVVVTEAPRHAGMSAELAASLSESMFDFLAAPVARVGGAHAPIPHSPALRQHTVPNCDDVVRSALALCRDTRSNSAAGGLATQ